MPVKQIVIGQKITAAKAARAREMRREMTPAEAKLWARLRTNRLEGFHFRRQQVIEPYIVDFYCHQAALVVEVDGGAHLDQQEYDQLRESQLNARGLQVLRFSNRDVMKNMDAVLVEILRACRQAAQQNED